MPDMLDLIYLLGQTLSLLALAAGGVMSLMASDGLSELFPSVRRKHATPVLQHPNHRLNPMDHSGYEW
jgi:hypothetical protein